MPTAPLKPCSYPGCPNLAEKGSVCDKHKQQAEHERGSSAQRGYGAQHRKNRQRYLNEYPLCADPFGEHAKEKRIVAATILDHILPVRKGGKDEESNYQGLCQHCHDRKRATDDKR